MLLCLLFDVKCFTLCVRWLVLIRFYEGFVGLLVIVILLGLFDCLVGYLLYVCLLVVGSAGFWWFCDVHIGLVGCRLALTGLVVAVLLGIGCLVW